MYYICKQKITIDKNKNIKLIGSEEIIEYFDKKEKIQEYKSLFNYKNKKIVSGEYTTYYIREDNNKIN